MISYSQQSRPRFFISSFVFLLIFILSGCDEDNGTPSTPSPDTLSQDGADNQPPKANITTPDPFSSGQTVTLNGSASSDPKGDTLSYQWTQTQGPEITLSDSTSSSLTFVAPTVTQATEFAFQLTVNDGELSSSASVSVQISPVVDSKSPSIVSRSPQPDQRGVSSTAEISVGFDEALLETSIDSQSFSVSQNGSLVSGVVSYDSANNTITNKPAAALTPDTTYTVTLANTLEDLAGNTFAGDSWDFSTDPEANPVTPSDTYGVKIAESIMARNPNVYGGWNYETGTVLRGFEMLYNVTGDSDYLNYIQSTVDDVVNSSGDISGYNMSNYNLDKVKLGSMALLLYELTGESRYASAAHTLMTQLDKQPQTSDGGNWHKKKYPYQMWLDGLYMAQPFNSQYGVLFNRSDNFDDVVLQLQLMEDHARDPDTGLLYHGWDESGNKSWANSETGTSSVFWGRSLGWYAMALVDVLDYIPAEKSALRAQVISILERFVVAISSVQDVETGVWWQVVDKGGQSGNWLESSSSAMFVYAIAKSVRLGYVDASYQAVAQAGWEGLLNEFITTNSDGNLNFTDTCVGTGVGDDYKFYINRPRATNDPKGLGPILMASAEMEFGDQNASLAVTP